MSRYHATTAQALHDGNGNLLLLHHSANQGDLSGVDLALKHGHPIDGKDALGRTALWYAVARDHGHVLQTLLERRADPNLADAYGTTPLHIAIRQAWEVQIENLLDQQPFHVLNVNAGTVQANTPLHELAMAQAENRYPEAYWVHHPTGWWDHTAHLLLAAGADPLVSNEDRVRAIDLVTDLNVVPNWHAATVAAEQRLLRNMAGSMNAHPPPSMARL